MNNTNAKFEYCISVRFYSNVHCELSGKTYEYFITEEQYFEALEGQIAIVPAGSDNIPTAVYIDDCMVVGKYCKATKPTICITKFEDELFCSDIHEEDLKYFGSFGIKELKAYDYAFTIPKKYVIKKGDNSMNELKESFSNKLFKKVDNVVIDMMTGKIGINKDDAIYTADFSGEFPELSENIISSLGMPFPAFSQATGLEDIQQGDIIVNNNGKATGWILEPKANNGKYKVFSTTGNTSSYSPITNKLFGGQSVMVVKNLFGVESFSKMQPNLMMMLAMSGGEIDGSIEKIMQMMLMSSSGMFGVTTDTSNNLMQMMMMSSMFK